MKLAHSGVFIFLSVAFLMAWGYPKTISYSASQVIALTENNTGKKLAISKGQEFTLTLPNRVDGGYRFDKEQYDTTVLRLEKNVEKSPAANSALGKPGYGVWKFIALKKGKTVLKITASRPWTKAGVLIIFKNTVVVK
jgi:predicted secreted protein